MEVIQENHIEITHLSKELDKSYKALHDRFNSVADVIHNSKVFQFILTLCMALFMK